MKTKKFDEENYNKPFPKRLRALLDNESNISPLNKTVTQTELAQAFHDNGMPVTRQTISLYANGETKPDIEKFKFIADYFNVSYDYLLGECDVTQRENVDIAEKIGLDDNAIETLIRAKKDLSSKDKTSKLCAQMKLLIVNYLLNYRNDADMMLSHIGFYIRYTLGLNKLANATVEFFEHEKYLDAERRKTFSRELAERLKKERMYKETIEKEGFTIDNIATLHDQTAKFEEWRLLEEVKEVILKMTEDIFFNPKNMELFGKDVKMLKEIKEAIEDARQNEER
jgi:transcriptional regulator with XRE-family HTH domain